MAFRAGLCLSMCVKCASSTSVAETCPARMAVANCIVLEKSISFMIAPACVFESIGLLLLTGCSLLFLAILITIAQTFSISKLLIFPFWNKKRPFHQTIERDCRAVFRNYFFHKFF